MKLTLEARCLQALMFLSRKYPVEETVSTVKDAMNVGPRRADQVLRELEKAEIATRELRNEIYGFGFNVWSLSQYGIRMGLWYQALDGNEVQMDVTDVSTGDRGTLMLWPVRGGVALYRSVFQPPVAEYDSPHVWTRVSQHLHVNKFSVTSVEKIRKGEKSE